MFDEQREKNTKQICWKCSKACNMFSCPWALYCATTDGKDRLTKEELLQILPVGTELDEENNIISCPLFEHDKKIYSLEELLKKLNMSRRTYYRRKSLKKLLSKGEENGER